MQDVQEKLKDDSQQHSASRRLFSLANWTSNLRTNPEKCCPLEDSFVWCCNLEISESRPKIPGNFCWRRMEKISWTDRVRNEEIIQTVKVERNILQRIKKGRLTGLVTSCVRNCLIK